MAWPALAAAIGAGASILGGKYAADKAAVSQQNTNYSNERINTASLQHASEEALLDREFQSNEATSARDFSAEQAGVARDFNSAEALKARDFSSKEALASRQFQERMSNTAVQRKMADLKKAGLNPMLAFAQGGASSPPGSTARAVAASGPAANSAKASGSRANSPGMIPMKAPGVEFGRIMAQTVASAVNSAIKAAKTFTEVKKTEEEVQNVIVNRDLLRETIDLTTKKGMLVDQDVKIARLKKIYQQVENDRARYKRNLERIVWETKQRNQGKIKQATKIDLDLQAKESEYRKKLILIDQIIKRIKPFLPNLFFGVTKH